MTNNIKKSQYWQTIRGICILAVIMIHCPTGQNYGHASYGVWLIIRQIINFPVAVFVFMAGYFIKPEKVQERCFGFFIKRGKRLLLPYLIWSCIYLMKDAIWGGVRIKHIIYAFAVGKAAAPFYYIIVLMQLTFITPWLVKYRKKWMYLITPVYLLFIYAYNIAAGRMPMLYETFFPAWFFFYMFGMDCKAGKYDRLIEKISFSWVVTALVLSLLEAFVILTLGCADGFAASQIKFSSFLYAGVLALWLQKNEKGVRSNKVSLIGDYSYGIFYVHVLVLQIICKAVALFGMNTIWILYFGLAFALTAVCSFIIISAIGKAGRKLNCEWVLKLIGVT